METTRFKTPSNKVKAPLIYDGNFAPGDDPDTASLMAQKT